MVKIYKVLITNDQLMLVINALMRADTASFLEATWGDDIPNAKDMISLLMLDEKLKPRPDGGIKPVDSSFVMCDVEPDDIETEEERQQKQLFRLIFSEQQIRYMAFAVNTMDMDDYYSQLKEVRPETFTDESRMRDMAHLRAALAATLQEYPFENDLRSTSEHD